MPLDDPSALAQAAPGALDEAWSAALRKEHSVRRPAWLLAADTLRDGSPDDRLRALGVYWALRNELEPNDPAGVPRIMHVLRSGLERDGEFATLAARAGEASDERLRLAGELCLAQCRSVAGYFAEAEQRLRTLLSQVRGTGTRLERTAYASLAVVYQSQGREFEALVLTRIVLRLSSRAEDPWEACVAHQQHCTLLAALGDWDHMDAALDDLSEALRLADPPWAWKVWRYIYGERAEAALERDDIELARESVRRMQEVVPAGTADVAAPHWHALLAARLALAEGRPAASIEYLGDQTDTGDVSAAIVAARAALALGEQEQALRYGRACLDALEAQREVLGGAAGRLRGAADIATLFEDHGLDPAEVRCAYDMAAEAAMRRIFELEHTMAHLPVLGEVDTDTMAALDSFRLRFRERHARLLDRLAPYLAEELPRGPFSVNEGHLRVCAWCHRIASRAEQWLPVGHLLPSRACLRLTHTICEECVGAHGFG